MGKQAVHTTEERIAVRVSVNSIIVNVVLSVFKFAAGTIAGSGAMISDAVHSVSDVFSTIVVVIGVKMAGKQSDGRHQYGHERLECVASLLLAIALAATGIGIGYTSITKIISADYRVLKVPGLLALAAAVLSIIVKETMYWYTRAAAKRINSGALMADAWHHRSDAMSSVGSFIGIFGARMGYPVLDPVAGTVICIFIVKAAVCIFCDAIGKMTDVACDEKTVRKIYRIAMGQTGVITVDDVKTRMFGNKKYVDLEISQDGKKTLEEAHGIAEAVHDRIESEIEGVKHCMVHVNPCICREEQKLREMEFKMERQGLLKVGQEVEVSESALPTSYYYTIIPAIAMSKNYQAHERLYVTRGIVKEINETDRGFYTLVEFDEEE